jgi:hypothetical protein
MNQTDVSLDLPYTCSDVQLKSPITLVISVIVANFALIGLFYAVARLIGSWWNARKHKEKGT